MRSSERESGLVAIAGSPDMKKLLALAPSDSHAHLAAGMFGYAVKKAIGSFVAVLGGIDLLIFTGGIGERAPQIRNLACENLDALGIVLDEARNAQNAEVISSTASRCTVRVVVSNEDLIIARHTRSLLARRAGAAGASPTQS